MSYLDKFIGVNVPVKIHAWEIYHHVTTGPHTLPCYLLTYVRKNHAIHIWNNVPHIITKGDLLLIHPGQMHRFVKPHDLYMIHCLFEGYELSGIDLESIPAKIVHVPLHLQKNVETLFFQIAERGKKKNRSDEKEQMRERLLKLLDIYSAGSSFASSSNNNGSLGYVLDAISMMQENRDIRVPYLAEAIGIHPDYLNRLFQEHLRLSVMDYRVLLRVMDAAVALEYTDASIKEIAESLGYSKTSNFCAHFKKFCAMTPTEYRVYIRKTVYI